MITPDKDSGFSLYSQKYHYLRAEKQAEMTSRQIAMTEMEKMKAGLEYTYADQELIARKTQAISISIEEVAPEDWVEKVEKAEIEPNADKMLVLNGEKKY